MLDAKKKLVLLVEDDEFLLRTLKNKIESSGFLCMLAHDGNEAMEMALKHKPNVILLDLLMPNKNGFEFLGDLKKTKGINTTKVVVLSNLAQESDIKEVEKMGAEKYMVKSETSLNAVIDYIKNII